MLARLRQIPAPTLTACSFSLLMHAGVVLWFAAMQLAPPRFKMPTQIDVTLAPEPAPRPSANRAALPPAARPLPRASAAQQPVPAEPAAAETTSAAPTETTAFIESRYDVATLRNPKPPYPFAARRRGEEGKVVLRAHVRADGTCAEVELKKSSNHDLLDASALRTVKDWRFVPAARGGAAVDSWAEIPVVFRLREDPVAMNGAER